MQASLLLIYLVLSLIVTQMGYYSAYLMVAPERTLQNRENSVAISSIQLSMDAHLI